MIDRKIIKKSIDHWKKMIKWAKKQVPHEMVAHWKMKQSLKEAWFANDCWLCYVYLDDDVCSNKCPLYKEYGRCGSDCSRNYWRKVVISSNWGNWVKNAKTFLKQLKSLL